ncbi:MAG: hypothetical protein WA268_10190 [Xanthobacteraceae bacterium]
MGLNVFDRLLQSAIERDALSAQNKFMEILTVVGIDDESGANVVIDECIVEDRHVRNRAVPCAILKDCRRRSPIAINNDVGSVRRAEALTFDDRKRSVCRERPEYGG